jgi:hypothetical protein
LLSARADDSEHELKLHGEGWFAPNSYDLGCLRTLVTPGRTQGAKRKNARLPER